MNRKKSCFGLIIGTRGFFNAELALAGKKQLIAAIEKLGYDYRILPEEATPTACVETTEDGRACAAYFRKHAGDIDGIVVSLPNFGDELGIVTAVHEAGLQVPVLLHAEDDDVDKVDVLHRRDAFCGKLSVANNFRQYDIPFTDTSTHTCKVSSDAFSADLRRFEMVCRVVNGIRKARIGAVGARPAAFQTMRVSEKLLQRSGITTVTVDHSEILFAALDMKDDDERVTAKLKEIRSYGTIPAGIKDSNIMKQAKYSVAAGEWLAANGIDAAGFQCWTSVQENYGCATCLTMSMLGEQLVPCACEVDIAGAVSMYALALASGEPSALLDWNNNYGDDRDKCVNTHCSNFPKSFIGRPEIEISELDVLGGTLGRENCFGAIKGKVKSGPMTFFRISTDDCSGKIRAYLGEGEFTDDPFPMAGGIAVCSIGNLQELMKHMVKNGYEHHVGMVRSHVADIIEEAAVTYLGWDVYRHR